MQEITIDDVIEFIIKNCDDTKLMDKINKTSFPFTTKYLNNNNSKKNTTTYPTNRDYNNTLCGKQEK